MGNFVKLRLLVLAVMLGSFAKSAAAQVGIVQLGIEAGASIATLAGSDAQGSSSRTSPYFGGVAVYHPKESVFGFQTGLLYVPKGATTNYQGGKVALDITYIEIPVLLRVGRSLQGSQVMPVVTIGGSIGIKTDCTFGAHSGSSTIAAGCDDSAFEGAFDLKTFDFGIVIGGALDIPVSEKVVFAPSISYTRGISVIGDTSNNADATNRNLRVGVSLRMSL